MTAVSFHDPERVVYDRAKIHQWLTVYDGRGSQVSLFFCREELAHAFALAVLRAVAKPETVISVLPEEGQ
jgi:hypothetical protein